MQQWEYLEMRVDAEWNYWLDDTGEHGELKAWELSGNWVWKMARRALAC